ncbi:MAG: hypothetical protein COY66_01110 [Candidatus Kerfeldbacteria bacterium CG_4_10_14_0_8_um_filter_42_10]|uniref:Right handed beta helix domain-containing protein n=1 Tax=Candidatus Kerfeldbacteria bacterium CG_4_10_14_0_8_um_filter_42_10 TaxID=2014248 RepID=A0A2M7RK50_9BACT|nr:MAG: hypothetical protein COY66_01110 [Candidatus Kerfeldbacteria bacterium CG_4_10_14_0_8_um_filter_42_10]
MRTFFVKKIDNNTKISSFYFLFPIIVLLALTVQSITGTPIFKSEIAKASGASYYVDAASIGGTCDNNNSGTIAQPWCTIQKATGSSSPVTAGDTIYVRAGTYTGTVDFYKSGTNGNPITLAAYQNETVNLSGELRIDPNAIEGYLAENWTFRKLNITNPERDGIHIANGNHAGTITIDDCNISHNKANGIATGWGNNNIGTLIIKNSTIQYNDSGHEDGNSGLVAYAYGTYIIQNNNISYNGDPDRTSSGNKGINFYSGANRCANCLIENNILQNNLETGIDFHGTNGTIRNNLIIGNGQRDTEEGEYGDNGLSMQAYAVNNKVYNNMIASSGGTELSVSGSGNQFYNNTLYKDYNYTATPVPSNQYYSDIIIWSGSNHVFRNNVIVNTLNISGRQYGVMTKEFATDLYTSQTWSNNLYYSAYSDSNYIKINNHPNLAALQTLNEDQNSLFAEPQLVNGAGHDFHLQPDSPAIDHGYNLAGIVTTDYAGTSRPQGSAYDIGAYERASSTPPAPAPEPEPEPEPEPVPPPATPPEENVGNTPETNSSPSPSLDGNTNSPANTNANTPTNINSDLNSNSNSNVDQNSNVKENEVSENNNQNNNSNSDIIEPEKLAANTNSLNNSSISVGNSNNSSNDSSAATGNSNNWVWYLAAVAGIAVFGLSFYFFKKNQKL